MIASKFGHKSSIVELLKAGADVTARDKSSWSAMSFASFNGKIDAMRLLMSHDPEAARLPNDPALVLAAGQLYLEAVQLLVSAGTDVNVSEEGWSALCKALLSNVEEKEGESSPRVAIADVLIEAGIDLKSTYSAAGWNGFTVRGGRLQNLSSNSLRRLSVDPI